MKVYIKDHGSHHGLVFTLDLIADEENKDDKDAMTFFNKYLSPESMENAALYTYGIRLSPDSCELSFADSKKLLAKVDGRWNYSREDQKFKVLVLEGESVETESVKKYFCYCCNEEVWGIQRYAVMAYDAVSKNMVVVNMHRDCLKEREKEISRLLPPHNKKIEKQ